MVGIIGGIMMVGLLLGAVTGYISLLLIPTIIGLIITGIIELSKKRTISNWKYKQYPPYGY